MRIVIALGGNALGDSPLSQLETCKLTARLLAPIIEAGHEVVLTHGNGPQVGLINLAFSEASQNNTKICEMPFSECGAMSQGYIGYHLQNALVNELNQKGIKKDVVSIITQVEVDPNDPAFRNPTKPIGAFYTESQAKELGVPVKEDAGRGWRRVVASPKPVKIIELEAIKTLLSNGKIVITCGGGGIPVIKQDNQYQGIASVIDKDFASSKLATDLNADCLLILTAVSHVALNYNKPNQELLHEVRVKDLEAYNQMGHFHAGSMKPKVEACIAFLKANPGKCAIITSIEEANNALAGLSGTKIY